MRVYSWIDTADKATLLIDLSLADLDLAAEFCNRPNCEFGGGVTREAVIEQITIIKNLKLRGFL